METVVHYLDANALAILFNTAMLVIVYLIARLGRVHPLPALATGFLPIYGLIVLGAYVGQAAPIAV